MSDKTEKLNKLAFEVDVNGKKVALVVKRPTQDQQSQAGSVYNREFRRAVKPSDGKSGAIVRAALDGVLREQKLWDDAKEKRWKELMAALNDGQRRLIAGKRPLSEGREVALQMRRDRRELAQLSEGRNALDANTAEAQAENARFNYLVACCTFDAKTGIRYYKDEEDYNSRSEDPVAYEAASRLAKLLYDLEDNPERKYPENVWLVAYGFAREDGRLIDKQGRLVDTKGRLINEEFQLINEDGRRIDEEGNILKDDGTPDLEQAPFLDDNGNPIPLPAVFLPKDEPKQEQPKPADSQPAPAPATPSEPVTV